MKRYYISRTDFYNAYSLVWADELHPIPENAGWERITRKEAERLCKAETDRCRYDSSSGGYAPELVGPWWISGYVEPVGDGYYMGFDPDTHRRLCLLKPAGRILDVIRRA